MRIGDKRIFTHNQAKLTKMLNLRRIGLSYQALAFLFGCDWTTIKHWCHQYNLEPKETYGLEAIISEVLPKTPQLNFKVVNGEKINIGKSYKEYLAEAKISPKRNYYY